MPLSDNKDHNSLEPFHVTTSSLKFAAIPICRESGSTRYWSYY